MKSRMWIASITMVVVTLVFSGCATTHQASEATPSGFLGDYSQLKSGEGDQALLVYKNPRAPWSRYKKVIIEPVQIFMTKDAALRSDSAEEKKALATYFTSALHEQLGQHFKIVRQPGVDVLRIRVALTDGDQSEVLFDTITTIMPIGLAVSTLKRVAVGKDTGVGFAQAEADILDSLQGVRLAAAVDKRYGTKALRSKFGSWNHAREAMDYWAEKMAESLTESGAGIK